ncbi:MAG: ABC transporter ATP-binding protein [Acidimicrobiales bacterium]
MTRNRLLRLIARRPDRAGSARLDRRGQPCRTATEPMAQPSPGGDAAAQVEARGVSKAFMTGQGRQVIALAGVDLGVAEGTFVSLIGPSGCGKSTLLRILGGLERPSTGQVLCAGTGKGGPSAPSSVRTAFVFQDYSLFPWLSVVDNVAFGLRMAGVAKPERSERARAWVARVGLSGFERAYPDQLSGGMRQRLSLARAFVTDPEVLFMDEPMGAVDPQTRLLLQEQLIRLWEETRKTVLLVTHSIEEALLLGDRVVVMSARPGRVKLDLEVGLPRPRRVAVTTTSEFSDLRSRLWDSLRDEVERSFALS